MRTVTAKYSLCGFPAKAWYRLLDDFTLCGLRSMSSTR